MTPASCFPSCSRRSAPRRFRILWRERLASRSGREAGTSMGWAVCSSLLLAAIGLDARGVRSSPRAIDGGMPDLPRLLSALSGRARRTRARRHARRALRARPGRALLRRGDAQPRRLGRDPRPARAGRAAHLRRAAHRCRRRGERRRRWRSAGRLRRPTFCNGRWRSRRRELRAARARALVAALQRDRRDRRHGRGLRLHRPDLPDGPKHHSDGDCRERLGGGRRAGRGSGWCALRRSRHIGLSLATPAPESNGRSAKWRAARSASGRRKHAGLPVKAGIYLGTRDVPADLQDLPARRSGARRRRPAASTARRSISPTASSISPARAQVRETAARHFCRHRMTCC